MSAERERLLCYAGGIYGSMMSNSTLTNVYSAESLMRRALRDANKLIHIVYDDEKLREILDEPH